MTEKTVTLQVIHTDGVVVERTVPIPKLKDAVLQVASKFDPANGMRLSFIFGALWERIDLNADREEEGDPFSRSEGLTVNGVRLATVVLSVKVIEDATSDD